MQKSKFVIIQLGAIFKKSQLIFSLTVYGQEEMKYLKNKFGIYLQGEANVFEEWQTFKYEFLQGDNISHQGLEFLRFVARKDDYPSISLLCRIILCFVAENATVERGFSLFARLKTQLRNKLDMGHVDTLMRLRLNSVGWKAFDYDVAYGKWLEGKRYKIQK